MSTRRALTPVQPDVARRAYEQMRASDPQSARLHLESVKRLLFREAPKFAR